MAENPEKDIEVETITLSDEEEPPPKVMKTIDPPKQTARKVHHNFLFLFIGHKVKKRKFLLELVTELWFIESRLVYPCSALYCGIKWVNNVLVCIFLSRKCRPSLQNYIQSTLLL